MTEATFEDHFSRGSAAYAAFRPTYPEALYDWLAAAAPRRDLAWDCATGNGQAAVALAKRFVRVVGSDASAAQIAAARAAPGVEYAVFPAEDAALAEGSVALVTVAQALHWFDHERFYGEVRRVLAPGGVLAAWAYELFRIAPAVDAVIDAWYRGPLDPYWPDGRRHIEAGYRTVPFPFEPIAAPAFEMAAEWTLEQVLGYLSTWSAVTRYREAVGADPLALVRGDLVAAWGEPALARPVVWPLSLLVGGPGRGKSHGL